VTGAVLCVVSLAMGGFDTGWTFYTPYSTTTSTGGVIPVLTAVFILGFSSIFTGLNFVVTVHKLRPPGMTWFRMPLFLWALYATAIIQVLATPVLGITLLAAALSKFFLVEMTRAEQGLCVVASLLMIAPGLWPTLAGVVLALPMLLRHLAQSRRGGGGPSRPSAEGG
jgi:cytochrome c oxidase subunit 1